MNERAKFAPNEALIAELAEALLASGCDLGNERAVIRALNAQGYCAGDVLVLSDAAAVRAKTIRAPKEDADG